VGCPGGVLVVTAVVVTSVTNLVSGPFERHTELLSADDLVRAGVVATAAPIVVVAVHESQHGRGVHAPVGPAAPVHHHPLGGMVAVHFRNASPD
jgi:hypothetical protein